LIADRIGRVRTLQITIAWFATFTALCGLAQSYNQLLAARALLGLGFGGEWAAGAVMMGAVIGSQHRGQDVGTEQLGRAVGRGALLATGAQGGYYSITTWLPTYLRGRGLSVFNTGAYTGVVIVVSFCGYLVSAWLSDRIGRKRNFYLFALCSMATVLIYTRVEISDRAMLFLGFPLGFFASGIFSGMGAFFTELFPTRIRGSGQGFTYNFGRGVGALF